MVSVYDAIGGPEAIRKFAQDLANAMKNAGVGGATADSIATASGNDTAKDRTDRMNDLKMDKSRDKFRETLDQYTKNIKDHGDSMKDLSSRLAQGSDLLKQAADGLDYTQLSQLSNVLKIEEQLAALQSLQKALITAQEIKDSPVDESGNAAEILINTAKKVNSHAKALDKVTDAMGELGAMGIEISNNSDALKKVNQTLEEKNHAMIQEIAHVRQWSKSLQQITKSFARDLISKASDARIGLGLLGTSFYKWQADFSVALKTGAPSQMWDAIFAGMDPAALYEIQKLNKRTVVALGGTAHWNDLMQDAQKEMFFITGDHVEAMRISASIGSTLTQLMGDMSDNEFQSALKSQIDLAEKLRNVAGVTADEFANLTTELVADTNIRQQLLLLDKSQRVAKLQNMQQLIYENQVRGISINQTKSLIKANAALANALPTERFAKAGKIMALGGALQLKGAQEFARALQRGKPSEEAMTQFGIELAKRLQYAKRNQQYGIETQLLKLANDVPGLLDAGNEALLEQREVSEEAAKEAAGQTGWLASLFGSSKKVYEGIMNNPAVQAFVGGGIIATSFATQFWYNRANLSALASIRTAILATGGGGFMGPMQPGGRGGRGIKGIGKGIASFLKSGTGKASVAGIAAMLLAEPIGQAIGGKRGGEVGGGIGGIIGMAGTGAMIGSVVPIIGTAAGAVIGGAIGAAMNWDAIVGPDTPDQSDSAGSSDTIGIYDKFDGMENRLSDIHTVLEDIASSSNGIASINQRQLSSYETAEGDKREILRRNRGGRGGGFGGFQQVPLS